MRPLWSESTQILQRFPNILSAEDVLPPNNDFERNVRFLEGMNTRFTNHPYFTARLAICMQEVGALAISAELLKRTRESLRLLRIEDKVLDENVKLYDRAADEKAQLQKEKSDVLPSTQKWEHAKFHKFPSDHEVPPQGHEDIREAWASLISRDPDRLRQYLEHSAVDTNHVESTFFISDESIRDIVHRGIERANISPLPTSPLHDQAVIRVILKDTVSAYYDVLFGLAHDPKQLTREKICSVQKRLMDTCRFQGLVNCRYIITGETRTATGATVIIKEPTKKPIQEPAKGPPTVIQFCPYEGVDEEVDFICDKVKENIEDNNTWTQNPFATASWLHYVLANCHPFEDGNGRTCRLIASIPLIKAGYPPININLALQKGYYEALKMAHGGDHGPLIRCLFDGMRATIGSIQAAI